MATAFGKIYTFGPTFRAENSNTARHLAEFWMIEPEMAFYDLDMNMDLAEDMLKYVIRYAVDNCADDMQFLAERFDKEQTQKPQNERSELSLMERLDYVLNNKFIRLSYTEAVEILQKSKQNQKGKFQYPIEGWGTDLQSEHERYICEQIIKGPVFLTDYPKDIKAFYMRLNDDQKTVAACDLLVPAIGELVGGSQREERYDYLKMRMGEMKIHEEGLKWYLDLRRFGGCQHAGFGLGFERFLMYITGMQNIRDVIPFARTPKNLEY